MKTDIKKILEQKTKQALSSNILNDNTIKSKIVILEELKSLIPPLSHDEFKQLEDNILLHGCQTPIQLWQTNELSNDQNTLDFILIDGHNRLNICNKHNLPYEYYILSFKSLQLAKDYMINLQLGRRNLSPTQIAYFRGLRYNNEKSDKNENLLRGQNVPSESFNQINDNEIVLNSLMGQNVPSEGSTAKRLANEYHVSEKTIKREAEFAKGLDKLSLPLKNQILSGKVRIEKGLIQGLGKLSEDINDVDSIEAIKTLNTKENMSKNENVFFDIDEKTNKLILYANQFSISKKKNDLLKITHIIDEILPKL